MAIKSFSELTIRDNWMFQAIMMDPETCRLVLECIMQIKISKVCVDAEHSIVYNPEKRGIRLDVYASDTSNTHFDVEMQVEATSIFKRSRYYHSSMDMDYLIKGTNYDQLPESYVIFICDYDPVGEKKYMYTRTSYYAESPQTKYNDGSHTIFLSTKGTNSDSTPVEIVQFLKYISEDKGDNSYISENPLVIRLQNSVTSVKNSREMEHRYMTFEEIKHEERVEECIINIQNLVSDYGVLPECISNKLYNITDLDILRIILKEAAKSESIEDFTHSLSTLLNGI